MGIEIIVQVNLVIGSAAIWMTDVLFIYLSFYGFCPKTIIFFFKFVIPRQLSGSVLSISWANVLFHKQIIQNFG